MGTETLNSYTSTGITLTANGAYNSPFTVTTAGTIDATGNYGGINATIPSYIANDGSVAGDCGIQVSTADINNSGTITGISDDGILLQQGTVTNSGTTAVISGKEAGIFFENGFNASEPGTVINAGTIVSSSGGDAGVILEGGGAVSNTGIITGVGFVGVTVYSASGIIANSALNAVIAGDFYGVYDHAGGTVSNAGTIAGSHAAVDIQGAGDARLVAESGAVFIGAVKAAGTGNTLEFSGTGGTMASIGTQFTGFQTIAFDHGASWSISGDASNLAALSTITGFRAGDVIDITGFGATAASYTAGIGLSLSSASASYLLRINGGGTFSVTGDGHDGTKVASDVQCFAAGTRILTPDGNLRVEELRVGDTVITVREGGPFTRRIIWTGRQSIHLARQPAPELLRPVCICAGALGASVPERDLRLSPHHAVYIDGLLFEAISLVNGSTIFQEQGEGWITYYHIELDSHDIVLAEGCPCESYLDTGSRHLFDMPLYPDFRAPAGAEFCVELIRDGAALAKARQAINARATKFPRAA